MLRFLTGRSGTGKTTYLCEKACELAKDGKKSIIVLPDQFTFEMEKAILKEAGPSLAVNIRVLSFTRLANNIVAEYGGLAKKRISDSGKVLSMNLAIDECKDELTVFDSESSKLAPMMLDTIESLKTSGISSEDFLAFENDDEVFTEKIREIGLVYSAYDAIVNQSYTDPSDIISFSAKLVADKDFFVGTTVMFDSFETFDKQKCSIIMSALSKADDVFVSLCMPSPKQEREDFFNPIYGTYMKLKAQAEELGLVVSDEVISLDENKRLESEDLLVLEKHIFDTKPELNTVTSENISIFDGANAYEELEYTAATIRNLIINDGYKYRDISVICADLPSYTYSVESIFAKWHIPLHFSQAQRIDSTPLIRLVFMAFNIAIYNFRTEDVLSFIKTGLLGLSGEKISQLENYVYIWKINGKAWKSDFSKHPKGYGQKFTDQTNAELVKLNATRNKIIAPLEKFADAIKDTDATSICRAIFELLDENKVQNAIIKQSEFCQENNLSDRADDGKSVWSKLMEVLDQFVSTLGEKKITPQVFFEYLKNVLEVEVTRNIPMYLDSVHFGSPIELLQSKPKVTFIVGCKRDAFPSVVGSKGLISEAEKKIMRDFNIEMENSVEDLTLIEKFNAYKSLTIASEKLYFTYNCKENGSNKSEVIENIELLFPELSEITSLPDSYYMTTDEATFSRLAREYDSNSVLESTLDVYFSDKEKYEGKIKALERGKNKGKFEIEDKTISNQLIGNNSISASQIDIYNNCAFRYFCQYSLNAREPKRAEINFLQYGTIMHYILEKVLQKGILTYKDNLEQLTTDVNDLLKQYAEEEMGGYDDLAASEKYRLKRMADAAYLLLVRLVEEFSQSKFEPKYFELNLLPKTEFPPITITTESGREISVGGKIDRVDTYTAKDGSQYVRVVDYKTGSKEFKIQHVLFGLNLQMLIYLCALTEGGKYLPAGVLYMPASVKTIKLTRKSIDEDYPTERDKAQKMNGIVNDNIEIIDAMEEGGTGKYIPVSLNDNGSINKSGKSYCDTLGFQVIFDYIKDKITLMAEGILNGNCEAKSALVEGFTCDYCPYDTVCLSKIRDKSLVTSMSKNVSAALGDMKAYLEGDEEDAKMDESTTECD